MPPFTANNPACQRNCLVDVINLIFFVDSICFFVLTTVLTCFVHVITRLLGICTNFPYVVMLSSAYDILDNLSQSSNEPDEFVSDRYLATDTSITVSFSIIPLVPCITMIQPTLQPMHLVNAFHMEPM